jgi:ABC-2 type transport system permease protein
LLAPFQELKKYWHVINIGIQNKLVYLVNFLFRASFGLIPLIATIYLWRSVYASKAEDTSVAGYSLAGMISYYVLITIVDAFTAVNEDDWQIAADIKDGNINQFLLKPIDYLWYRLCLFFAGRAIYVVAAALPVGLFVFFQRKYFVLPTDQLTGFLFLASVIMTALLQFFMSYMMAMLAFWVLEVSTFIFILFAFEYIAGGHLFPLDILPPSLALFLKITPFPYQLFFPVSIYLGRSTGSERWLGLLIQLTWLVIFYALARAVWNRGIRRYTAVGG